jgi:hypothetical protein
MDFHLFGPLSNAWEVGDYTIPKKWKLLLMYGCECKTSFSTEAEFLNSCPNGTNASMCLEIMLKNNNNSLE